MKKNYKIIIVSIIITIVTMSTSISFASKVDRDVLDKLQDGYEEGYEPAQIEKKDTYEDPITNPDFYKPTDTTGENTEFINKANIIIGTMRAVGTVIAVVALMIIGLRYMFGSIEEKANYKETMLPYLIGAIMLFTIPNILGIIYDLVKAIDF